MSLHFYIATVSTVVKFESQFKMFCATDFRSEFLGAVSAIGNSSSKGMFINTCYTHCQSEDQSAWFGKPTSKLYDKVKCSFTCYIPFICLKIINNFFFLKKY